MEWNNDNSKLKHDTWYLIWWERGESYGLQVYFKYDIGDTIFCREGFYWFDGIDDLWKFSRTQPKYFMEIERPKQNII